MAKKNYSTFGITEMRFRKTETIKRQILDWGNVDIIDEGHCLKVMVGEGSLFYAHFKQYSYYDEDFDKEAK